MDLFNKRLINEYIGKNIYIVSDKGLFYTELESLMRISKIYTNERFKKGALSMDADEVRFILDDTGVPIRVMVKKRIDTMRMIEEWMLAANRAVAIKLSGKESAGSAAHHPGGFLYCAYGASWAGGH